MTRTRATSRKINFYGLEHLGYRELIPLTGDWASDQLSIEMVCFRIGHRRREGGLGKFGHFKAIVDICWNNDDTGSQKKFVWCRESEMIIRELCEHDELGIAGPTSLGKTEPMALWCVVCYMCDPSHTKVFMMSTSLQGAKDRIWGRVMEYLSALPDYPGLYSKSYNCVKGPNYTGDGYSENSGMYLLAGEQAKEKETLEKLIGRKAPRTGRPDNTLKDLKARPEFADLAATRDEETLADLLPRLVNLSEDRVGKIIIAIDEATGITESVLTAIQTNLQPGNAGHIQVAMAGNPNLHWDVFGLFCKPKADGGYDSVSLKDYSWETVTGGRCIRFSAENNSRITDKRSKVTWMLTQKEIDHMIAIYGVNSPYVYRFIYGMWCPQGMAFGVYSQADVEQSGAMGKATWGYIPALMHSHLDPSFSAGGDKASATFFKYGDDQFGRKQMEIAEQIAIEVDAGDKSTDISYQVVRAWRRECVKRKVEPDRASFDVTGAPSFAGIVKHEWSGRVLPVNSGGKPSGRKISHEKNPDGTPLLANQRFGNKATEMWYGAHPFLRSGQIRGMTRELAKELCSRKLSEKSGEAGRIVRIEDKRIYKKREGHSPDDSDSFLGGLEQLRVRHGFKADSSPAGTPRTADTLAGSAWEHFKKRARMITTKTNLPR